MVEVFALEPDLRPPQPFRPTPRMVDRAGPAHEMLEFVGVFGKKIGIQAIFIVSGPQLVQRMHQGLGNKRTAILAKMPIRTGQGIGFQGITLWLRSEEHTSELQSLMRISYAVFCLKKKNNNKQLLSTTST